MRALCDRIGAALLLDDIRCGLRLDLAGSWEPLGVRPDLSAWSKCLANGHPLGVLLGADSLRDGAAAHGLTVSVTGPPPPPYLTFAGEAQFERATAWAGECGRHGVFLHPTHNWFLSTAHDDEAIGRVLDATDEAFRVIRQRDGAD